VARLHGRHDPVAISAYFSMVTRWITTIGFPIALAVAILRLDLLRLFDTAYEGDTVFMLLLLVPPLLSVTCGLAGNIIVMTGHSMWNLLNSTTVAVVNVLLNLVMIPRYGLIGAVVATVIASTIMSAMQLIEAKTLLNVALIVRQIFKPYVAILPPVALMIVAELWLPALSGNPAGRIAMAAAGAALFFFVLAAQGVESRDVDILFPFLKKKEP
jgi:O-antigen/teichoic acid export membrane protein